MRCRCSEIQIEVGRGLELFASCRLGSCTSAANLAQRISFEEFAIRSTEVIVYALRDMSAYRLLLLPVRAHLSRASATVTALLHFEAKTVRPEA